DARKLQETLEGSTEAAGLDDPLSGQEDATLDESQINLQHFLTMGYVRPPNVGSLREWGQELLPSGKHRALTFEAAFHKHMPYAAYMEKMQKAPSDPENKGEGMNPDLIPKESTTKPIPEDEEWKLCPAQEP
ncbi:unnamed protein product, partial [Symbiodinium pilosum]